MRVGSREVAYLGEPTPNPRGELGFVSESVGLQGPTVTGDAPA